MVRTGMKTNRTLSQDALTHAMPLSFHVGSRLTLRSLMNRSVSRFLSGGSSPVALLRELLFVPLRRGGG